MPKEGESRPMSQTNPLTFNAGRPADSPPRWTLITNHGLVLSYLSKWPTHTMRQIASHMRVTERTIAKTIRQLEAAGYMRRWRIGRRNVYRVKRPSPLRHHTKQDVVVSDLLDALRPKERVSLAGEPTAG